MPGPAHLLELRNEIGLTPEQAEQIASIYAEMRAEAQEVDARLIEAERSIEAAFREGTLEESRLRAPVEDAESARAELRLIHLSRHLSTPTLLTEGPIAR